MPNTIVDVEMLATLFVVACWAVVLACWVVAAFWVKPTVERQARWPRAFVVLAIVAIMMLRRHNGLAGFTDVRLWSNTWTLDVVAAGVTAMGLAITLWARAILAGNWSASVAFKEGHELVERGPYRYVRHPIYSGVLLMGLGSAILDGRVGMFIALLALSVGLWVKSRQEERLLAKHFPDAYPRYRVRVRALIPFVL